jgi:uracil-DNA glycosylase family 4
MNNKKQYLKEMEIELWQNKRIAVNVGSQVIAAWPALEKQVAACVLCGLNKTRTRVVFGVGNKNAAVMFIGEAPGANEDLQGEPFVGRAGMLLNSMLQSIGLKRSDVYIANILKCRPPNNRDPKPQEVKLCTPYLEQQIALIQPKILVAVGRIAAQFLLNTTESMGCLRGQTYQYGSQNTPLIVTYHPAYLLRSPSEKRKAYVDFLLIKKMVGEAAN